MLISKLELEVQEMLPHSLGCLAPFLQPQTPHPSAEVISAAHSFLAYPDGMITPSSVLLCDLCVALIAYITVQGNDVFTCLSHSLT